MFVRFRRITFGGKLVERKKSIEAGVEGFLFFRVFRKNHRQRVFEQHPVFYANNIKGFHGIEGFCRRHFHIRSSKDLDKLNQCVVQLCHLTNSWQHKLSSFDRPVGHALKF